MANMFDQTDPDNTETVPRQPVPLQRGDRPTHQTDVSGRREPQVAQGGGEPDRREPDKGAIDTDRTYGGAKFGGKKFGGNTYGGQKFGGSKTGIPEREREPTPSGAGAGEQPPPDNRSWGERNSLGARPGGNTYGGQTHGGQTFGGSRTGIPERQPEPTPSGAGAGEQPPEDKRSWGERHSLGLKPGGNKFGGNTFGGNTFGGNTFGASKRPDPTETGGQPDIGIDRTGGAATLPDAPEIPNMRVAPSGVGAGEQPPIDDETGGRPDVGKPTPYPILRPKAGVTPPGKPGGAGGAGGGGGGGAGGGKGGGAAGGRRKALGDQTRTEAYDPTLDRADPRNIAIVDESGKGRVNPRQWERAQKGAIDPTKPGERTGEAAAKYTNHYTAALEGATNYMADMFHQKKGDPNQAAGYGALTFKATGAPDPKVVAQVFNVVDPKNELEPKERMELATRAMHDFYVSKGDKKSADQVAAEMLQHGNKQAQALGNQALQAMKKGDRETAVQAIKQAYDWLPDGFHANVADNKLTITNDQGKTVNSFPLDDKMIANLGTGLGTGTLFWDVVQQRGGKPGTITPPEPQPTQAIATAAPAGPPGAAPGSPPGAAPAGQARPAPAGPPGQVAAAPSPAPPPAGSSPPVPGTPAPPPGAAPTPQPVRPPVPPVTPPSTRPVAPAPAAPGPAPTQAPVRMPGPGPAPVAAGTGIKPVEMEVVNAAPPPTLQPQPAPTQQAATPQPSTTPPQGSGGPPGSPAGQPAAGQPQAQAEPKPGQAKPNEAVWDTKDPDTVPKINGKPAIVRRATYPMTDEAKVARDGIAKADAKYQSDMDWWVGKQKTLKGTTDYQKVITGLRNDIEKTHKLAVDRHKETYTAWKKESDAHDKQERDDLKARPLEGTRLERAETIAKDHFGKIVEQKGDVFKNSALRLYDTPEKQAPLIDAVSMIKAINPMVSEKKIAEMVTTAVTHVGSGDGGKKDSLNDQGGEKGSRFLVVGEDLARNPVLVFGDGNSRIQLHVPRDTLNDLKRLKIESYKNVEKTLTDAKNKPKTDYSTLVPGRVTETIADVKEVVKGAQDKQKAEGRDMKPDAPVSTEGKTTQQIQEEQRKKRRQAPTSPTSNVEP